MSLDDNYFIDGLRNNNSKIIKEYYQLYFPKCKTFILKNSGSKDEAWDVFQDTTCVLLKMIHNPSFELRSSLYSLLYGIWRNLWLKELKDRKKGNNFSLKDNEDIPSTDGNPDLERYLFFALKFRAFEQKDPRCHKILSLYNDKVKMKMIAEIMNLKNEQVARKEKSKCKNRLIDFCRDDPDWKDFVEE